jgi:hypothetical protein
MTPTQHGELLSCTVRGAAEHAQSQASADQYPLKSSALDINAHFWKEQCAQEFVIRHQTNSVSSSVARERRIDALGPFSETTVHAEKPGVGEGDCRVVKLLHGLG